MASEKLTIFGREMEFKPRHDIGMEYWIYSFGMFTFHISHVLPTTRSCGAERFSADLNVTNWWDDHLCGNRLASKTDLDSVDQCRNWLESEARRIAREMIEIAGR